MLTRSNTEKFQLELENASDRYDKLRNMSYDEGAFALYEYTKLANVRFQLVPKYTNIHTILNNDFNNKISKNKFQSADTSTCTNGGGERRYIQVQVSAKTHRKGSEEKMSRFVKACSFCGFAIEMSDEDGSWRAYNEDGNIHSCSRRQSK